MHILLVTQSGLGKIKKSIVLLFRRNPQDRKISSDNRISGESAPSVGECERD